MRELSSINDFSSGTEETEAAPDTETFLHGFYQYLEGCTPLSAVEEARLWTKIEKILQKIRKKIYAFGFVLREHIQLLGRLDAEDLEDMFRFPENGNIQELAAAWEKEIAGLYENRRENFLHNPERTDAAIQQSVKLLMRYPVHAAKLREWFRTAKVCLSGANPDECTLLPADKAHAAIQSMAEDFNSADVFYQQIVTANLRLVVSVAKQYHRDGLQLQDLIQDGTLGLLQALDRFDHTRGYRFTTYATWWIKQGVLRSAALQTRIIRLPAHMLHAITKIRRAENQHIQKYGREPEISDLVPVLGMSAEKIRAIQKMTAQPISLLAPVGDMQGDLTLEQILPQDEDSTSPEKSVSSAMVTERLKKALKTLSERERQILIMRFGLGDVQPKSVLEISHMFRLSKARIRQIEAAALAKLRNPEITGTIDEYYD